MNTQILLSTRKHMPLYAEDFVKPGGFDGIELVMLWEDTPERVGQFRRLQHVKVIHAPITDFDATNFRTALVRGLELAKTLNVPLVNMHPGALECGGRKNVLQCYEIAKELSLQYNCVVAIEILPKPEKDKHRQQRAYEHPQQWVDDLKRFKLAGTIDTTHLASWGVDPAEYVPLVSKQLAHLHVSDYQSAKVKGERGQQHLFIGDGSIRFGRFFREVRKLSLTHLLCITLEQAGRFDLLAHEESLQHNLAKLREYVHDSEPSAV